jgi:chemotaxis protein histidine kinase CheA
VKRGVRDNAIAHVIETPSERQSKGKQPVGIITVRAFHQGNQTVISVSGDGRIMPIADVLEIIDIFQGRTAKQIPVVYL